MVNVIEQIEAYDIPTHSYIAAIQYMTDDPGRYADVSLEEAVVMIQNIVGFSIDVENAGFEFDQRAANYILAYLVQESIRAHLQGSTPDSLDIYNLAIDKALSFIENNPWVFAKPEEEERIDEATGKPKMKKGKKQEIAADLYKQYREEGKDKIIEVFQAELDMSKAGARTYYYNMRKKFGDT
jgi:hypothetical protein